MSVWDIEITIEIEKSGQLWKISKKKKDTNKANSKIEKLSRTTVCTTIKIYTLSTWLRKDPTLCTEKIPNSTFRKSKQKGRDTNKTSSKIENLSSTILNTSVKRQNLSKWLRPNAMFRKDSL